MMLALTYPRSTPLHHVPAAFKLLVLCAATTGLFFISDPITHLWILVAVMGLYRVLGTNFFKTGLRVIRGLWPFVVILALWHLATQDIAQGLVIITRMITAVAMANLVTLTTRLDDMIGCFVALCRPLSYVGIAPQAIALSIALVIRFIPVLMARADQLAMAYRARSSKNPSWRIILPLALSVLDDVEHVADALRARGGIQ